MKKHKCKNPNGCTCDHNHDRYDENIAITDNVVNNGYDPAHPYMIPIQDFVPFGDHSDAQPVVWPANFVGDLNAHVDYMADHMTETGRLMKYMCKNYAAPDSYVCTRDNKLGYGATNPGSGRFMYAMEFGDNAPPVDTILTFTENNGLRHAGMNEENELVDMGPVTNPVVIGPRSHPQALVVPMSNIAAVAKAKDMLHNAVENYLNGEGLYDQPLPKEDAPKIEKRIDSMCMHTLPMFAAPADDDKLPF